MAGKKLVTDTTWEKAKNALNLALKNAKTKYAAGQKNYTKETWDAFARAYAAANKQSNAIAGNSAAANLNNLAKALNTALGKLKESLLNASVVKVTGIQARNFIQPVHFFTNDTCVHADTSH